MTERDGSLEETVNEEETAWEPEPDITADAVAEQLGEAFIEAATAGTDPHQRRDPAGLADLEPEETAIKTIVDEVLLTAAFDEFPDPD